MDQIVVIAKLTAREGMRPQLVDALWNLVESSAAEPGTLIYLLHADKADASVLWIYEVFANDAARVVHRDSDALKAAYPAMEPYLARKIELFFTTPLGGKGLTGSGQDTRRN